MKKSYRTPIWGVVPPIPELTSGRKIKGTETRGHTMKEIGTSLMTGQKRLHTACHKLMSACVVAVWWRFKARFVWTLGCRPGDADKSPPNPTPLTFLSPSPSLMFLPQSHNTHTDTHTHFYIYFVKQLSQ